VEHRRPMQRQKAEHEREQRKNLLGSHPQILADRLREAICKGCSQADPWRAKPEALERENGASESKNGATRRRPVATDGEKGATARRKGTTGCATVATAGQNGATGARPVATARRGVTTARRKGTTAEEKGVTNARGVATGRWKVATERRNGAPETQTGATERKKGLKSGWIWAKTWDLGSTRQKKRWRATAVLDAGAFKETHGWREASRCAPTLRRWVKFRSSGREPALTILGFE
jgi:hypothetical protein